MRTRRNVMLSLRDECKQSTYTMWRPGACRVGAENPGLQSLSSSLLTPSSPRPHQNYHMVFHCQKTLRNSSLPNIRSHCVGWTQTKSWWQQKGICCATHSTISWKNNLNDILWHTNCPNWVSLFYFSHKLLKCQICPSITSDQNSRERTVILSFGLMWLRVQLDLLSSSLGLLLMKF